ncbi:sigma-70 family RNA polymerase sigma factor [Leifsonia sp. L25]|uniref:sigma-70 family RNA polymerase sigma factor n=1 Tax=Actinomycetes TaxID=1760 RepID=UPI003D695381
MNTHSRDQLVIEHLPLVGYIVSDLCSRGTHLDRDELASAGQFALFQASRSFDPDRGVPFGAYARARISGALADELRSQDWVSRGTRKKIKETLVIRDGLYQTLGRTPTIDEMAVSLGVDRATVVATLRESATGPVAIEERSDELVSAILGPEDSAETSERETFLRAAVEALPERLQLIVTRLFFEDRQVKDVAAELGVTHAAVSLARNEAMKLLHEGWLLHFDRDAGVLPLPDRNPRTKRSAYLAKLAEFTAHPAAVTERVTA